MDRFGLIVLIAIVIAAAAFASGTRLASASRRYVVFRLGRFLRVSGPGLVIALPLIDRLVSVDLGERLARIESAEATTGQNAPVAVDLEVKYKVVDPAKAILGVENVDYAVRQAAVRLLGSVLGVTPSAAGLYERERAERELSGRLREMLAPLGVELTLVRIREIRRRA